MATKSTVGLPADGSGKKVECIQNTDDNGNTVQRQVVALGDASAVDSVAAVDAAGNIATKLGAAPASQFTAAAINSSASGNITLVGGVNGKTVKVYRLLLAVAAATNLTFKDGSTALTGPLPYQAGGGPTLDNSGDPWFTTSSGNGLVLNSTNAVQISGVIHYVQS